MKRFLLLSSAILFTALFLPSCYFFDPCRGLGPIHLSALETINYETYNVETTFVVNGSPVKPDRGPDYRDTRLKAKFHGSGHSSLEVSEWYYSKEDKKGYERVLFSAKNVKFSEMPNGDVEFSCVSIQNVFNPVNEKFAPREEVSMRGVFRNQGNTTRCSPAEVLVDLKVEMNANYHLSEKAHNPDRPEEDIINDYYITLNVVSTEQ